MASWIEVAVPNKQQVTALPSSDIVNTTRGPCFEATVACDTFSVHTGKLVHIHIPIIATSGTGSRRMSILRESRLRQILRSQGL